VSAKAWLEETLSGAERVALPWVVLLGFIRVSTHAQVLSRPLNVSNALAVVDSWLARPQVIALYPREEHWLILQSLLAQAGTAGNLTTDAHLAALAIERSRALFHRQRLRAFLEAAVGESARSRSRLEHLDGFRDGACYQDRPIISSALSAEARRRNRSQSQSRLR
jgi:uncharacterized protein